MNLHIRPATLLDVAAIAELHSRTWRETYGRALAPEILDELDAERAEQWEHNLSDSLAPPTWLGVVGGDIVGFARADSLSIGSVRSLELQMLYILTSHHGQGIGSKLLNAAIGDAPALLWVWEQGQDAQAFYRRHGFELDGLRATNAPAGVTQVRMVR